MERYFATNWYQLKGAFRLSSRSQFDVNMMSPTKAAKETWESIGISNMSRSLESQIRFYQSDSFDGSIAKNNGISVRRVKSSVTRL